MTEDDEKYIAQKLKETDFTKEDLASFDEAQVRELDATLNKLLQMAPDNPGGDEGAYNQRLEEAKSSGSEQAVNEVILSYPPNWRYDIELKLEWIDAWKKDQPS